MSVTAFNLTGSFPSPSVLQSPLSPLVSLAEGQPFTRHWWLRRTTTPVAGSIIVSGDFRVLAGNSDSLQFRIVDAAGNLADWTSGATDLWSNAEFRSLLVTYDGNNVRAWVEGIEVPLVRGGAGTGVIRAGGAHYVVNSSPLWTIDEPAFVRGQVLGDPTLFRAGPQTQRRIGTLPGLTYWVRFENANEYVDAGPNALPMAFVNDPGFTRFDFGPGVALEAAPSLGPIDAPFRLALLDLRG